MTEEPTIDQMISEFLTLKGRNVKTFDNWKECSYSVRGEPLIVSQTIQPGLICNFVHWKNIEPYDWYLKYKSYQQYASFSEDGGQTFKVRTNNPGAWLDRIKDKLAHAKRFSHIKEYKGEQLLLPF